MDFRVLAVVWFLTAVTHSLPAQGTRLLREPTLSATQVAFTYGADLWIADRTGGLARRLTSTPAVESDPHFSPDGKRAVQETMRMVTAAGSRKVVPPPFPRGRRRP